MQEGKAKEINDVLLFFASSLFKIIIIIGIFFQFSHHTFFFFFLFLMYIYIYKLYKNPLENKKKNQCFKN